MKDSGHIGIPPDTTDNSEFDEQPTKKPRHNAALNDNPHNSTKDVDDFNFINNSTVTRHEYGSGNNGVLNITHCGTLGNQTLGLGIPRNMSYLQNGFRAKGNLGYRQLDNQMVRYQKKLICSSTAILTYRCLLCCMSNIFLLKKHDEYMYPNMHDNVSYKI